MKDLTPILGGVPCWERPPAMVPYQKIYLNGWLTFNGLLAKLSE
jgi:hypothetical protein